MELVKNSTILVTVENVLNDIIVVSYSCSMGVFQGVLMNSAKKILPCGITLPQSVMSPKTDLDEDKLFSVSQRFTYFQDKLFRQNLPPRFQKSKKSKVSKNNMTVRLRPRQVLCSKCKGICNENSENVDHSKRKETSVGERRLSHPGEKSPRLLLSENQQDNQPKNNIQIPSETKPVKSKDPVCSSVPHRVTRLRFGNLNQSKVDSDLCHETGMSHRNIDNACRVDLSHSQIETEMSQRHFDNSCRVDLSHSKVDSNLNRRKIGSKSLLNKRKYWLRPSNKSPPLISVDSMDEREIKVSADDKVMDTCKTNSSSESNSMDDVCLNETPAEGSETPTPNEETEPYLDPLEDEDPFTDEKMVLRKKRSVGSMEDLWDESVFEEGQKKALRITPVIKISFGSQGEGTVVKIPSKIQTYNPSESEAEEKAVRKALKKAKKEARRKLSMSPLPPEESSRRHKRKEKHKKKHKEVTWPKLSINLKRLNATEYNATCKEQEDESCSSSSVSDEECPPDFPPTQFVPKSEKVISSCVMSDGNNLLVGDIVWGKVHGFPWWPGKVLSISLGNSSDESEIVAEAHVSWFGSSTSSMMPCNQLCPFLDHFKLRFNKRKKSSCYKEAIRQATEATNKKTPHEVLEMIT